MPSHRIPQKIFNAGAPCARRSVKAALALALASSGSFAAAAGITDSAGDFLATFAGSAASTDLDVVSASVTYDPGNDTFLLSSTMNGAIGTTASGFYVWGVNRGAGTANFAANGIDGVRFDRAILLFANGTGTVNGVGNLAPGSVTVSGDTITASVSGSFLASTGFAKLDYTWNLWPRDGAFTGFAQISDFAPDNANFSTALAATAPVPEPQTYALMLAGLGAIGWLRKRGRPDRA